MSEEKKVTEDCEKYVRSEVAGLLDTFLPNCSDGAVAIKYKKTVQEETESGPVYIDDRASGVEIVLDFNFIEDIDMPS